MVNVKKLVEQLPDESLLRGRAWRELQPLVKLEMEPYAQGLKQAVTKEEIAAAPGMQDFARREAELAGASITNGLGAPTQASVINQINRARVGKARFRELFTPKQGPVTPWTQSMFRVVDTKVRAGMIEGLTTQQIADKVVHETITRGVPGVSLRGETAVRTIRAQAMAMSRTVTQDVSRQIREELYDANSSALKDFVYLFTAALDSRTCPTCAPLDGRRYNSKSEAPTTPLHVNCRCQVLLIDPEDEFWDETKRTGQQISETPYKTGYKTKVKVKGEKFYRKAVEFNGTDYSDYLASSTLKTQTEFFGGGRIGERRARYFRNQMDKVNKDPQDILSSMLTGPRESKRFIPLPDLALNSIAATRLSIPKPKVATVKDAKAAADQKYAEFLKREEARKKARAVIEEAKPKVASAAGMNSDELNAAIAAANKKVKAKIIETSGINPVPLFEKSDDMLGSGLFGVAKATAKGVAKKGTIAKAEIQALKALKDTGVTPKLLGEAYFEPKFTRHYSGIQARKGAILMTRSKGSTIAKYLNSGGGFTEQQALNVFDELILARKKIHLKGVAHQDMHAGNVLWDFKAKKISVIDLGMARVDARSALVEALGTNRGRVSFGKVEQAGDFQSRGLFKALNSRQASSSQSAVWKRFNTNRKAVQEKLINEGAGSILNASIRKLPRDVTKNLSQARALELLEELYEGI